MVRYSAKLTAADQVCPMTHTPALTCFRCEDTEAAYVKMQEGVRKLVRAIPYLAGYVSRGDQGYTTLNWDDNVTGDEVQLERLDGTHLPSFQELADRGMNLHDLDFDFKPTGCLNRELVPKEKEPALLMAFTFLKGGCITAFAPMHQVCDGVGQVVLMRAWAALTAGRQPKPDEWTDPMSPLKRYDLFREETGLEPSPFHKQAVVVEDKGEISRPAELERAPAQVPLTDHTTKLSRKMFTFSSGSVERLRQAVAKDTGSRPPYFLSVLAALFWVLITDIRQKRGVASKDVPEGAEAKSSMMTIADARVVFPSLGPNYMGNFLSPAFTSSTVSDFASSSTTLKPTAPYPPALPQAVKLVTDGLKSALNPFTLIPKLQAILNIPDARLLALAGGNPMGPNDVLLTSWQIFEYYPSWGEGIGMPECHRAQPTANETRRSTFSYIVVLPRRKGGDGQIVNEVFTCFEEEDMKELEKHPLLTEWLYKGEAFAKPGSDAFRESEKWRAGTNDVVKAKL